MNATPEARSPKDGPFAWASKEALRLIHEQFSESCDLASGNSVYLALCCLASDEQNERFTAKKALIAFRAGVSIRTADSVLSRFELMALVRVDRQSVAGTKMKAPSTYTLLRIGNGCASSGNGCISMRSQQIQPPIAEKVEESGRILEESQEEPASLPSPIVRRYPAEVLEGIYQAFPRREGRQPALKAIGKALEVLSKRGTTDPIGWLLARVHAYAHYCQREGKERQHIKMPQGWFNDGRYDDDLATTAAVNAPNQSEPTPAEIVVWLETQPKFASKRAEWTTWDKLPPFAREKFHQHRKSTK